MTENEKLRALLAEARGWVGGWSGILPVSAAAIDSLRQRIDAALAEPVVECARCEESEHQMHLRIRSDYDKTIADSWRAKVAEVERERDEARVTLEAICSEFEGAVAHADWRAAGSPGMSVPFTGDFASATQLPSVVSRMRWWAREMRRVIGEKKP